MQNIFIAPKLKIGFNKRQDCFTGKLAYIIYYDNKGKLRKETSWENWRDKKIDPVEFDNVPTEGFTLNKDVKRYTGDWFSSNRTLIRVHDPRGFEFEITTENLIGVLMHTDCLRRGLVGEFVYAWIGKELVLIPTNSEEYQNAVKFTSNLSKSVTSKSLVVGASYKTKRSEDVVYVGRVDYHSYTPKNNYLGLRRQEKKYVFTDDDGKSFFTKDSVSFLSVPNTDHSVSNYPDIIDAFKQTIPANKILKYEFREIPFDPTLINETAYNVSLKRASYYVRHSENVFRYILLQPNINRIYNNITNDYVYSPVTGYTEYTWSRDLAINAETGEFIKLDINRSASSVYPTSPTSPASISGMKFYSLFIHLENGKVLEMFSFDKLRR